MSDYDSAEDSSSSDIDDTSSESSFEYLDDDVPLEPVKQTVYIPECDDEMKPYTEKVFNTLAEGIDFYKSYAARCGFGCRKGSVKRRNGDITLQYMYCSKEGFHKRNPLSVIKPRASRRTGCKAMISLSFMTGTRYEVKKFHEVHNHDFYRMEELQFLRSNRNLTEAHKKWIIDSYRVTIGPVRCHKLLAQRVGGSHNVGATVIDFLNFERDLKVYIGETDGHFVLQTFHEKASKNNGFFFDHGVDEEDRLSKLFWADPVCRENYKLYGDTIIFDSTYNTNRYGMVFCPFTAVDNHDKCITVGFGLIGQEDAESFAWLFKTFLKCMDGKQPNCIVTDQDPAMKKAVEDVLTDTRHRLCMWHIMQKLNAKVPMSLLRDTKFFSQLHGLVWSDSVDIPHFEKTWHKILADWGQEENEWLVGMYDLRHLWIPAYFKDTPMGLLVRTTSRSESQNSVYGKRKRRRQQLVQFIWWCDSVLDDQRHAHTKAVMESSMCIPKWLRDAPTELESHAWEVYTRPIFEDVQKDIDRAIRDCDILNVDPATNMKVYHIADKKGMKFETVLDLESQHCTCTCKRFECYGKMCIHILNVLQTSRVSKIPPSLINPRWCRDPTTKPVLPSDAAAYTKASQLTHDVWILFQNVIGKAIGNLEHLNLIYDTLEKLNSDVSSEDEDEEPRSKTCVIEELTGLSMPESLLVKVPNVSRTKGTSRLKSTREIIGNKRKRVKRKCGLCGKIDWHDKRTCPLNKNRG